MIRHFLGNFRSRTFRLVAFAANSGPQCHRLKAIIRFVSSVRTLMPYKASMDPENWMYYFEKSDQAARDGEFLPTLEDLYCGMSFFCGSVAADAREWSEHIIPHLAEKGQEIPRNQVQFALERLTVSVSNEDLKFANDEIVKYRSPPEMLAGVSRAAKRLVLYRVARGDESVRLSLVDDLIIRIRWITCKSSS